MNYISFSLWGDNPLYNVGAIRNAEQYKNFYPDWKMVLYFDKTVPETTIKKLEKLDVLLIDMSEKNIYGMFWRFLAESLENAEYIIFRDCDSRLSLREKLAVEEWVLSGKNLHVMRDHPAHKIPYGNNSLGILGGMWGIKGGIIPLKEMIYEFALDKTLSYGSDQTFLKSVYQILGDDKITHDEFFEKKPFPIKREGQRFIGERINIDETPLTDEYKSIVL